MPGKTLEQKQNTRLSGNVKRPYSMGKGLGLQFDFCVELRPVWYALSHIPTIMIKVNSSSFTSIIHCRDMAQSIPETS